MTEPVAMSEPQPTDPVPEVAEFDNAIQSYVDHMAALRYADLDSWMILSSDRWPPSVETALADGPAYSYSFRVSGFPDGHLAVTLYRDDGTSPLITEFQRLVLADDSSFITHLVVRDERVTLTVFGKKLVPYCPEQVPLEIQGTPKKH
jgi:hypothetical protein